MTIITNRDGLLDFCEENGIKYSIVNNFVYISAQRVISSWSYLNGTEKIVFTKQGFKIYYHSSYYDDCRTIKLKNCWVLVKTRNEIIAISKKILWSYKNISKEFLFKE